MHAYNMYVCMSVQYAYKVEKLYNKFFGLTFELLVLENNRAIASQAIWVDCRLVGGLKMILYEPFLVRDSILFGSPFIKSKIIYAHTSTFRSYKFKIQSHGPSEHKSRNYLSSGHLRNSTQGTGLTPTTWPTKQKLRNYEYLEVVCTARLAIGFLLVLSKWCAQSRLAIGF